MQTYKIAQWNPEIIEEKISSKTCSNNIHLCHYAHPKSTNNPEDTS